MPPSFYRVGAVASALSVLTTLGLIFLPRLFVEGEGIEVRMGRVGEPAYLLRSWVYFFHPIVTFTAALAVFWRLRVKPALMVPGVIGFGLWAAVELGQQCMTLFMFDPWRKAWLAGDAAVRATMDIRAAIYDGLWDMTYYWLLAGFLVGCTLYAWQFLRLGGFSRIVGAFMAAVSLLTLSIWVAAVGGPSLPPLIDEWAYPAIQPLGRALIAVWLWIHADETLGKGGVPAIPPRPA